MLIYFNSSLYSLSTRVENSFFFFLFRKKYVCGLNSHSTWERNSTMSLETWTGFLLQTPGETFSGGTSCGLSPWSDDWFTLRWKLALVTGGHHAALVHVTPLVRWTDLRPDVGNSFYLVPSFTAFFPPSFIPSFCFFSLPSLSSFTPVCTQIFFQQTQNNDLMLWTVGKTVFLQMGQVSLL